METGENRQSALSSNTTWAWDTKKIRYALLAITDWDAVRLTSRYFVLPTHEHGHHCSVVGIAILREKAMLCQWHSHVFGQVD
jgi:hypothetical protein